MRRLVMFLLTASLMLTVSSCSNTKKKSDNSEKQNVCDIECDDADMSEYETMQESDHVFKEITFAQSNDLLERDDFTGIIYYGFPSCPWCIEAVPVMNTVAKEYDLSIYYVNKRSQESADHPEEEKKAIEILDAAYGLDKDEETNEPRLYVPEVIVVKDGEIVGHNMGTVKGHDAHERKMTSDEALILKTIYENLFIQIKD